jgi:hypothetical protein
MQPVLGLFLVERLVGPALCNYSTEEVVEVDTFRMQLGSDNLLQRSASIKYVNEINVCRNE